MTTAELLSSLRERNVRLWVEAGKLKIDAPQGALDPSSRQVLVERKDEIVALLASAETSLAAPRSVVPLKPTGTRPPLFARPGHNGDVFCYLALAKYLDPDRPLYGVEPKGLDGGPLAATVEEMAAYEVEQIRGFQPEGPYLVAGFCAGGMIAFESARQLVAAGHEVERVLLFGAPFPTAYRAGRATVAWRTVRHGIHRHGPELATGSVTDRLDYVRERVRSRASAAEQAHDPALANRHRLEDATTAAIRVYEAGFYPRRVDAFLPSPAWRTAGEGSEAWHDVAAEVVEHVGPDRADGDNMLREPHVQTIANLVNKALSDNPGGNDAAE
jgi:thioesterase domain-containing protein